MDAVSCYICGRVLHGRHELDHFPVSKCIGGESVLPICLQCHEEKDRTPLMKWDATSAFTAMSGLWSKASATERLFMAKVFHVFNQMKAAQETVENDV